LLAILLVSSAVAQLTFPVKKKDFLDLFKNESDAIFDALDTNKDGRLSKEELATPRLKEAESRFDNTDTNKDGLVTEAEEQAAFEKLKNSKLNKKLNLKNNKQHKRKLKKS